MIMPPNGGSFAQKRPMDQARFQRFEPPKRYGDIRRRDEPRRRGLDEQRRMGPGIGPRMGDLGPKTENRAREMAGRLPPRPMPQDRPTQDLPQPSFGGDNPDKGPDNRPDGIAPPWMSQGTEAGPMINPQNPPPQQPQGKPGFADALRQAIENARSASGGQMPPQLTIDRAQQGGGGGGNAQQMQQLMAGMSGVGGGGYGQMMQGLQGMMGGGMMRPQVQGPNGESPSQMGGIGPQQDMLKQQAQLMQPYQMQRPKMMGGW